MVTETEKSNRLDERVEAMVRKSPEEMAALSPGEIRSLVMELRAHQTELEARNDALRQARKEAELSRDRFSRLFHQAPAGYLTLDAAGIVREANQTFADMVGAGLETLIGVPFSDWVRDADGSVFHSGFKPFFRHPENKRMDLVLKTAGNRDLPVRIEGRRTSLTDPGDASRPFDHLLLLVSHVPEQIRTETAYEESERRYRLLFDQSSDAIFIHDMDGHFLDVNDVAVQRLGYSRETLLSMTPMDIDAPDYALQVPERLADLRETGHCFFETVHVTRAGLHIPTELSCRVIDYEGSATILSIARDITDRKRKEDRLRQNEARFRLLAENMPVLVNAVDRDGRFVFWNRKCETVTGYAKEEIIDDPGAMARLYPDPDYREALKRDWEASDYGYIDKETTLTARDGTLRHILWSNLPADLAYAPGVSWAVGVDITGLRRSEAALRENREHLATTLRSIGDAVIAVDIGGRIVSMNPVAETLTGWAESEVRGRSLPEIFVIRNRRTGKPADNPVERVLREGKVVGMANHTALIARDGSERQIADSAAPIRRKDGALAGVVMVFRDVTEEYRTREELRFQAMILNQIRDVVVATDLDGRITYVNEAECRLLGRTRDALLGQSIKTFGDDPGRGAAQAEILETVRREGSWRGDVVNFDADGNPLVLDARVHTMFAEDGRPMGLCGISTDISARKRIEEALRRKTEELDTFFASSLDLLAIADTDGRFRRLNPEWERSLGYDVTELKGASFFDFIHPDDVAPTMEAVSTLSRQHPILNFTNRYRHKNGGYRWIEWRSFPIGNTIYACARDITDRIRAEEERRRLAEAVHQTSEAVMVTDAEGVIEYVNPSFERITGYRREEAVGRNPRFLKSGVQDDAFYRDLWTTIAAGRKWSGRMVNRRKDGKHYTEDCSITPLTNGEDKVERFVAVKKNISRELKLEEQFRQSQRLESVGRLAAGVAHDLNNLLAPILGYAEILMEDLASQEDPKRKVAQIIRAAEGSRDLIRQLLAFGRKQILDVKTVDLRQVVRDIQKLLLRTIRENIELECRLSPAPCPVEADTGQLGQVLMNLAVNAQDAMPDGGTLTIEVARTYLDEEYCESRQGSKPGHYIMMSVSDTGTGMDARTREHIFEPFFTTKAEMGTGLGLATVYGIVKQHGGNIWLYSEPGEGTAFKIYLPAAGEDHGGEAEPHTDLETVRGVETVLVVEDNEMVRDLACRVLERQGYAVFAAATGDEALQRLDAHQGPLHLLLTDVVMPDMDGMALSERVSRAHPEVKVLFMSGYTENVIAHHGVLKEGIHFIQKPFSVAALARKIRETLED